MLRMTAMAGLLVCLAGPALPAEKSADAVESGKLLFGIYCANCHGESARGDGPTAEILMIKPADLTAISRKNGGEFPSEEVYRKIDGREKLPGHGRSRMPIWGIGFQDPGRDTNQEGEVRTRIRQLVRYLESIQENRPGVAP